ncbi:CBS domain-containing protein [Acidianus ambivalens]|uniref:CBS domain-containing protein n=2 Tax=Acidianus ambivalens TaxID=2283 RepID=A0A650CW20_ACIAM|nr:CBS domain-containing protein [Acidianus ambivalens]QGR22074.1 CBS domain-containing protein [Acidianus ambivalens]
MRKKIIIIMKVGEAMSKIVVTVRSEDSGKEVIEALSSTPSGRLIVMSGDEPVGIISSRDVVKAYSKMEDNVFEARADEIATKGVITVDENEEIGNAVRIMASKKIGSLVITSGKVLRGIFTERDVIRLLSKMTFSGLVESIMSTDVITIPSNVDLLFASKLMEYEGVRRLPVVRGKEIEGIITAADIVKALAKGLHMVNEIETRNPIGVKSDDPIMKAVRIMNEKRIGSLLVDGIKGIVTERDVLYASLNEIR